MTHDLFVLGCAIAAAVVLSGWNLLAFWNLLKGRMNAIEYESMFILFFVFYLVGFSIVFKLAAELFGGASASTLWWLLEMPAALFVIEQTVAVRAKRQMYVSLSATRKEELARERDISDYLLRGDLD